MQVKTNNKLVLAFIAFTMLAMAATTTLTQEAYAKPHTHLTPRQWVRLHIKRHLEHGS
jgi:hypothetical protein